MQTDFSSGGIPLLVLDLETAPLPDAAQFVELPARPDDPTPHKGLKDKVKVAEDWEKRVAAHAVALDKWEHAKADAVNACALNPDLAQIITVGAAVESHVTVNAQDLYPEAELIRRTAATIGPATIVVGFNVRFDLGMLKRRALYLGVPFPDLSLDRYKHPHLIDLQDVLSENGYWSIKGKSLDFYAERFHLDVPEDTTGGGEKMPLLYAAGDWAAIRRHCECDVIRTRALAERLGVLRPVCEAAF